MNQPAERRAIDETQADSQAARVEDVRESDGFLPEERMADLRSRWADIQTGFVDDPQTAVEKAHDLVTRLVNELTETFARERGNLESQWGGGGEADTEDLRIALRRYRNFFNKLLGS